nr:MAG TPA: hypothetical protein [Caudoviricetes sp.]
MLCCFLIYIVYHILLKMSRKKVPFEALMS